MTTDHSSEKKNLVETAGFFSIKEAIKNYIKGCESKQRSSTISLFWKAIFSGLMVGMGAAISSVAAHSVTNVGLARLTAAVVFPVGLMMVILLGMELFTGDCLAVIGCLDKKTKISFCIKLLVVVYLGNMVGGSLLAFLICNSGQLNYSGGLLGAYTIKVAVGKVNLSFMEALISGILCNILVCFAVLMAACAKDITGKLVAIFFVIMIFVVAGFEHCVANMYYITAGMLAKGNPDYANLAMEVYGYTEEQIRSLNLNGYLIKNLIPVTLGNSLGGALFVGAPLYYLNRK